MLFDFDGRPVASLVAASIFIKLIVVCALLAVGNIFPSFDSSTARLIEFQDNKRADYLEPFIRWDTVHFISIARNGYQFEQQTAFMPGLPWLMGLGAKLLCKSSNWGQLEAMVWTGILASAVSSTLATITLYK
jgi:phosphatidylinositol glycan class V